MQELTDNPAKTPVASSGLKKPPQGAADPNYLKFAIKHYLTKAEQEPAEKERNRILLEHVRPLNRRFRGIAGRSIWWPISFGCAFAVFLVALLCTHWPKAYVYQAPDNYWRILHQIDDHSFVMQRVYRGTPQIPVVLHFKGYKPNFEIGMTLSWFAYDDLGDGNISITPEDRGYVIVRGPDYWPKLASNCWQNKATDRVECNGEPKF